MFLGLRVNILLWKQKINFVGARHLAALQSDFFAGIGGWVGKGALGGSAVLKLKTAAREAITELEERFL